VSSSPFFLTTAIDYANGKPHLGTAYEKITADVIARYKRLCGIETHFLMGLDEHSLNVYRKAREQGSTSRSTTSSAPPSRGTRSPCRR
jgi:methionyl-tRNA synthetase